MSIADRVDPPTSSQALLERWNRTQVDYPRSQSLADLFEAQVERTPERVAAEYAGQSVTYAELNRRANRLAHRLQRAGVAPEVLVGVCLERSLDMLVALLGILKAGGGYVPLDPFFPLDRLAFMAEDAGLHVLLTQQSLRNVVPTPGAAQILLDGEQTALAQESAENLGMVGSPDQVMYVLYTSGSTGKPKGVQVLQGGVVNLLWSMKAQPGLTEHDVLLAVTTLSFDIACVEFFLPLLVGAKVLIASRETTRDGARLIAELKQGVTVLQGTPATWRLLLQSGWSGTPGLKMLSGGEAMSRELARQLLERGETLWNLYGPTETTIYSTAQKIEADDTKISIGRPIANTQIDIVDPELQPVAIGEVGELLIRGDGVARGYLHQPELTAAKFLEDPCRPGSRIFCTGDCGCFLPDGRIDLLGRMDHQIKIHGYRIELGEVEATLASHPSVQTAVVTARDNDQGTKILVGYFVVRTDPAPTGFELRTHLKKNLPEYMVPSVFVPLAHLPLTPSGKIDRKALPIPDLTKRDRSGAASDGENEPGEWRPRDTVELQLAHIWEQALGVHGIGIRDNYFDLGGDSLLAAMLFAEIEKVCGNRLSLATLLQAPTIEQLAQELRTTSPSASWSPLVTLQAGHGSKPPLFLIHPVGGNVIRFRPLMLCFPADQSIHALQSLGMDGRHPLLVSVEEMAARYLVEIRAVQPEGPYFLVGYSFGGLVAYEIAQHLHAAHQKVELALLDTPGPRKRLLPRFWDHVRHFCALGFRGKIQYIFERIKSFKIRLSVARRRRDQAPLAGKSLLGSMEDVEAANYTAEQRYQPRSYPGAATLFRAREQALGSYEDPTLGWGELIIGGLQVHDIPGSHLSMTEEPNVRLVAAHLQERIRLAVGGA